jgi:hypothetical protein
MEEDRATIQSVAVINIILGAWLIISPWILGYTSTAAQWNQTILGIIVVGLAILRGLAPRQQWLSFLTGLVAIWAIIAPFILTYDRSVAYWNEIIVAIVVGILAFWNSSLHVGAGTGRMHGSHA